MIKLFPKHLRRYRDIGLLLIKHGHSDIVRQSGLTQVLDDSGPLDSEEARDAAEDFAADLEALGPTFVKLGQFLSTRPDLLPENYLAALARLQDDVEPIAFEQIDEIVTAELGMPLERAFADFDPQPLASASLGQTHRARMHDGTEVVVKVQRPGIRQQVGDDLEALDELSGLIDQHTEAGRRHQFQRMVIFLRKTILRELNYLDEADNLRTVRENLSKFDRIVLPAPIDSLTTSRILTMQYIAGEKITDVPLDHLDKEQRQELALSLFQAYLQQLLVDGVLHADPHPGNIYLTPEGKLGLLDLGMVVRVPSDLQEQLVKLLLAIAEGQSAAAADCAVRIGNARKDFDEQEFRRSIGQLVTEYRSQSIDRLPLGRIMLTLQTTAAQTGTQLPEELMMLSKALLHLEEVLERLDSSFELDAAIKDFTAEVVQRRAIRLLSPGTAYQTLFETTELVSKLPRRANRILELLADNQFSVNVDAIDEKQLIQGIQKIANRITMGLLLAALIIGASLMMDVATPLTFLGYPVISLFFFMTAGVGALVLIWRILLADRVR